MNKQIEDISDSVIKESKYLQELCKYGVAELKPSFYNPITQDIIRGESHCQDVINFSVQQAEDMVKQVLIYLGIETPVFYSAPTLDRVNTKGLPVYVFKNGNKYHLEIYAGGEV